MQRRNQLARLLEVRNSSLVLRIVLFQLCMVVLGCILGLAVLLS